MQIKGFIDASFSDWDGKVSSVLFLPRCNFRCPFCYNTPLVLKPEKMPTIKLARIENYLKKNRKWIDGVVITGGEPTIQEDLPALCNTINELGYPVKLDTNGTNPVLISELIDKKLIEYVAMDIKAPLTYHKYSQASGVNVNSFLEKIKQTIESLINHNIEYEFRTTTVPNIHTIGDISGICQQIKGCKKYALQNFKSDIETINPKFRSLKRFSKTEMENFQKTAQKYIQNVIIRG
jgi:pyruvate formate lyase activating enzyme